MKIFKKPGKYPFVLLLIFSTIILTVIGYVGKNNVYTDYSVNLFKNPQLAVVFEGIKDGNYPWKAAKVNDLDESTEDASKGNNDGKNTIDKTVSNKTEDTGKTTGKGGIKEGSNGNNSPVSGESNGSNGSKESAGSKESTGTKEPNGSNGTKKPTGSKEPGGTKESTDSKELNGSQGSTDSKEPNGSKESKDPKDSKPENNVSYEFATVKESYFKDALFIGDSRTVGLSEYSGWKDPTYYANVGLTIYDVFDKKIAEVGGQKLTVEEALKKKNFKKIYIMLGINEMGTGTAKTFTAEYKKAVDKIEKLQPDAIIFVEAIMNVTKKKSDTDPIFNNKNIKERNEHLAQLADNKKVFYIDVNEAITDNTGGIPAKYTFDNIHLKAVYYKIWTDFLLKHGVVEK